MLQGKKILLGVTGSIAAYKTAHLIRLFIKAGAEVKVIMTPSAADFISPLTLSTLSKQPVLRDLFDGQSWANHVMLGRWADVMIIAPLSCNTLSKMANGGCDNLLLAVYLSATCPVMVAPAMDEDMWLHPSTKSNIGKLISYGNKIIPVDNGELASGLTGPGRMAEPEAIIKLTEDFFLQRNKLKGKKILITAGPTYEPIDPVRFIGNRSSGKMGVAIAAVCRDMGADVTLVIGPVSISLPKNINIIHVDTAAEMYDQVVAIFEKADIAVLSAAVADYTIEEPSPQKIKKNDERLALQLKRTADILKTLGERKRNDQLLIGFALETHNEREFAIKKLESKNADYIIMNSLQDAGAGFGHDTNKISIFDKAGNAYEFDTRSKKEVAADIINTILKHPLCTE